MSTQSMNVFIGDDEPPARVTSSEDHTLVYIGIGDLTIFVDTSIEAVTYFRRIANSIQETLNQRLQCDHTAPIDAEFPADPDESREFTPDEAQRGPCDVIPPKPSTEEHPVDRALWKGEEVSPL